jgi:hypothetical protein
VGEALEARVTSTADRAGDKVADTIEPHDTTTTSTTSTAATPGAQRSP